MHIFLSLEVYYLNKSISQNIVIMKNSVYVMQMQYLECCCSMMHSERLIS